MDKAFEIQRQARDNVKNLQTYLTDLQNWETEMKRKEAALSGEFEQDLPLVRSKVKKDKPVVQSKKTPQKRITSSDYSAWEKFDVDKACEEVEMEDKGPVSLDSKKSETSKQEKLREEAQYEKERGNTFVKNEKWDEAISCYNRAIELVKDDAIYYANRALCYLKKDSLHQAEADCTESLKLDPTYVKALQRRATAREKLGSLRAATHDLEEVLKFEPNNAAARRQLMVIKARMGTKGAKSKSSPLSPSAESKSILHTQKSEPKIVELPSEIVKEKELSPLDKWKDGVGENITVIKPVKKPPHLRSKRALKHIPIQEVPLGTNYVKKPATRLKIIEIEDNAHGDANNNPKETIENKCIVNNSSELKNKVTNAGDNTENVKLNTNVISKNNKVTKNDDADVPRSVDNKAKEGDSPESVKLITNVIASEKSKEAMVPPVNSVQFMSEWKYFRGNCEARSDYLSIIDPSNIPSIFANALESDVLSEVLHILHDNKEKFKDKTISAYLQALCKVKRFSALAMFLSSSDKQVIKNLLDHCKLNEKLSDNETLDLKNKYEL